MKTIQFLFLSILISMVAFAMPTFGKDKINTTDNPLQIKAQIDLPSKATVSYQGMSQDADMEQGVSLGLEYSMDRFYGFGVQYQIERSNTSFIPIYLFVRAYSTKAGIQGNIGYNTFSESNSGIFKTNGGLYLGCSAFLSLNESVRALVEYSVNNGALTYGGESVGVVYPKVSLGIEVGLN